MTGDGQGGPELTPEECIRAGMYWFGRSDFEAARAWWERAVELDPQNRRALECLRLLERTSSTGFTPEIPSPFIASGKKEPASPGPISGAKVAPLGTTDPWSNPTEPGTSTKNPTGPQGVAKKNPTGPQGVVKKNPTGPQTPVPRKDPTGPFPAIPRVAVDPFDFAADGQRLSAAPASSMPLGLHEVRPLSAPTLPWDEGPSRTSVVNFGDARSGVDAVAEATPLPELDRGRFFGREAPTSREEIVDFLRATGDLPKPGAPPGPGPRGQEIVIDEPVDLVPTQPLGKAPPPPPDPLASARDRFQLHDFDGAITLAEQVSLGSPGYDEARSLVIEARAQLLKMYESKVGNFGAVPRVLVSSEEMIWLNLNHRAGFILSQIDGQVTYEDIVSLSGMPRLDTVRILADLIRDRVIG